MSGGSYDYAFTRVQDMASAIRSRGNVTPLREAFADHLELVSMAMHAVEWVDSCDYKEGDEVEKIRKCLSKVVELEAATNRASKAMADLSAVLDQQNRSEDEGV